MDARLDGICGFGNDSGNPWLAGRIKFDFQGREISVAQYFQQLGQPLRFPNAPVLKLGRACVPAEVS